MRTFCWCSVLALLAALVYPAGAAIGPSFSLDYSSFHATDIVLVRTVSEDDSFEVVESWKGDVGVGERLVVPELRPAADAVPISTYAQSWPNANGSEAIPKQPLGSHMILFLRRTASAGPPLESDRVSGRRVWLPSDLMHSMKDSVVWVDGKQMYCFTGGRGEPSTLNPMPDSLEQLRNRVSEIVDIQRDMEAALSTLDGHQRAEALKPYVRSESFSVQLFALDQLGRSGSSAAPTIREMLDDPAFADHSSVLIEELVKAGGRAVGDDLNSRLLQELAFWRSAAPSLPQGWWNADPSIHAPLREEFGKTAWWRVGGG